MLLEDNYTAAKPTFSDQHFLIVLSGCSGAGKSSLLSELASRGYEVNLEPGRQIIKEQIRIGGDALPWKNDEKFSDLLISRAMLQFNLATLRGTYVVFDRSLVDTFAYLKHMEMTIPLYLRNAVEIYKYAKQVFLVPPWQEIFENDTERTHSFEDAEAQYGSLVRTYKRLRCEVIELPKVSVSERADFFQEHIMKKSF